MTNVADLYVEGYSKPLGQWSDNALAQLREDVCVALDASPSKKAKIELYETFFVVEAEQKRRAEAPERAAVAVPEKRPLLSLFRRSPAQSAERSSEPERTAQETKRETAPESAPEAAKGAGRDDQGPER